jgi:hypothetical protein
MQGRCAGDSGGEVSELEGKMRKIAECVHQRSPNAKVIFVDYVTVLPATGSCPDKLPLSEAELERATAVSSRLAALTEKVAKETGSGLVKASELTEGHDVCSGLRVAISREALDLRPDCLPSECRGHACDCRSTGPVSALALTRSAAISLLCWRPMRLALCAP